MRDHGPGVPPDERDAVFEPFRSGGGGTTGVGLAICRAVVEAHGGTITVRDLPGGGAAFTVIIPLVEVSMLVVEDEPTMREMISGAQDAAVTRWGWRPRAARGSRSPRPHRARYRGARPRPAGHRRRRGLPAAAPLVSNPMVVVSADGEEDRKVAALGEGADDDVTKPFSMRGCWPAWASPCGTGGCWPTRSTRRRSRSAQSTSTWAATPRPWPASPCGSAARSSASWPCSPATAAGSSRRSRCCHVCGTAATPRSPRACGCTSTSCAASSARGPGRPAILNEPGVGYRLVLADGG